MEFANIGKSIRNGFEQLASPVANFMFFCTLFVYFAKPFVSFGAKTPSDNQGSAVGFLQEIPYFISTLPLKLTDDAVNKLQNFAAGNAEELAKGTSAVITGSLFVLVVFLLSASIIFDIFLTLLARFLRTPIMMARVVVWQSFVLIFPPKYRKTLDKYDDWNEAFFGLSENLKGKLFKIADMNIFSIRQHISETFNVLESTKFYDPKHSSDIALTWLTKCDRSGPWLSDYDQYAQNARLLEKIRDYFDIYVIFFVFIFLLSLTQNQESGHIYHAVALLSILSILSLFLNVSVLNLYKKIALHLVRSVEYYKLIDSK